MMLAFCVSVLLCVLVAYAIAKTSLAIIQRLGIDPLALLLWLGLAERPIEPRSARRRLGQLL